MSGTPPPSSDSLDNPYVFSPGVWTPQSAPVDMPNDRYQQNLAPPPLGEPPATTLHHKHPVLSGPGSPPPSYSDYAYACDLSVPWMSVFPRYGMLVESQAPSSEG